MELPGKQTIAKFGFFGCRTIRLVCRRGTAGTTPRPPLAAFCYAKTASVKSTSLWTIQRPTKRAAAYARRQTIRPSNNARRQPPPGPVSPKGQLSTPSQRSRDPTRDRMAELTAAKKPRRTRQPTEKRLPVSSPARATEITPPGGSPSHSVARPHRVAARRESARGQRAAPDPRPRRRWPLEPHAAPPAPPAGTPMSRTCAAAWKTPLAQPGHGAFA